MVFLRHLHSQPPASKSQEASDPDSRLLNMPERPRRPQRLQLATSNHSKDTTSATSPSPQSSKPTLSPTSARRSTTSSLPSPIQPSPFPQGPAPPPPLTPLTPPLRLHLRTIIPSPPITPAFIASLPSTPYPWIWRCHVCGRGYRLGATRRCLEDGHVFCSGTGKSGRRCGSEFDYQAWEARNFWRREILRRRSQRGKERERMAGIEGVIEGEIDSPFRERNCWMDCNFPSECHAFRQWRARENRRLEQLLVQGREVISPIDEQEIEQEELQEAEEKAGGLYCEANAWSSSSSDSSFGSDVQHLDDIETGPSTIDSASEQGSASGVYFRRVTEEEYARAAGIYDSVPTSPIGIEAGGEGSGQIKDCDGLGEQAVALGYVTSKRRVSIDALARGDYEEPKKSPLKSEFGWDEKEWDHDGGIVRLDHETLEEDLRCGSLSLRRFKPSSNEELFGDEADGFI
ncbi:hypothetical protein BJ875DRAFT_471754 [Amylocarpus encephaloides]|uniref:Uncharacterized protein n=1 Tax=Amylocarpus encephaloides TaxID=45428 RepID=A0A9P8C340_9HELO|nr:hypothetical protein BJ875DRAFT_471754 [Amylocarpus encephaloides]